MSETDDVDVTALREVAEIYRLDEYVPTDHADLVALLDEFEALRGVVARVEAIAHSAKANTYRDEACRGVVQLPYASNRYVRLLDDIRAALRGDNRG